MILLQNKTNEKIKFNPEIHMIIYDTVYKEKDMIKLFLSFLESETNSAPFLFQLESKEIFNDENEIEKKFKTLIQKYVIEETEKQINLSNDLRKETMLCYENFTIDNAKECIHDINSLLYKELFLDSVNFK